MASRFLLGLASLSLALLCSCPVFVESDLRADAQVVINQALAATQGVIKAAKSVQTGGNRDIVETCIETSGDAIDNLNDSKELLKARDRASIDTLKAKVAGALTDVGTCDDEFGDSEPPQVAAATKKAEDLINQLLVIVNKL
ncbi:hypothetical protein Salat_0596800 [Sesamum alatum]|uniref:Pectinesterase inhibitor domain-containing protein n=1 Tax=Sesamum alatum TaxID=300844 RepID=A0AAE1YPN8_9LAMI|nr:hypothetical protein Salat_0596800 [Sesamum alatum]